MGGKRAGHAALQCRCVPADVVNLQSGPEGLNR